MNPMLKDATKDYWMETLL